ELFVQAVHQERHPAATSLERRDAKFGKLLRHARKNEPGHCCHALKRKGDAMNGDKATKSTVHPLCSADAAVQRQADPEPFDLLVEWPKLAPADVLVAHIGRHHNADEAELLYGAAHFTNRGVDILKSDHRHTLEPASIRCA